MFNYIVIKIMINGTEIMTKEQNRYDILSLPIVSRKIQNIDFKNIHI